MISIPLAASTAAVTNAAGEEAEKLNLPFFYLYGFGVVLASLLFVLASLHRGASSRAEASHWKRVVLRSAGGTSTFPPGPAAAALGAPVGDTGALSLFAGSAQLGGHCLNLLGQTLVA